MIGSATVGRISAMVRVALSLSAACPLVSCRVGYELVQLEHDDLAATEGTGASGGITGDGSSNTGSGGAPTSAATSSTHGPAAHSVDGGQGGSITPFEATTTASDGGQAGAPSTAGAAGETGTSSTGGSDTGPASPIVHCNELRKLDAPPVPDGELE